jgi:hypothetical protein
VHFLSPISPAIADFISSRFHTFSNPTKVVDEFVCSLMKAPFTVCADAREQIREREFVRYSASSMDFSAHSIDIGFLVFAQGNVTNDEAGTCLDTHTGRQLLDWPVLCCPKIKFNLSGNTLEHKQILRTMFDYHVRRVHSEKAPKPE